MVMNVINFILTLLCLFLKTLFTDCGIQFSLLV